MKIEKEIKHAIVATDIVIFTIKDNVLCTVVSKVDRPPHYVNINAFLGGLMLPEEDSDQAVKRILESKHDIKNITKNMHFEQFKSFSKVDRDKRGRVVSIAYIAVVNINQLSSDSEHYQIIDCNKLKKLAYDHNLILTEAIDRLRFLLQVTTISKYFLEESFTLSNLHQTFEIVLNKEIDKRNFLKKIKNLNIIEETGEKIRGAKNRPAMLYAYSFDFIKNIEIF